MVEEANDRIKLFVSGECGPCQEVRKLVEEGRFNKPNVDIIDVTTDEGYPEIEKMHLTKVPIAFRGTEQCTLKIDEENKALVIQCPGDPEEEETEQEPTE